MKNLGQHSLLFIEPEGEPSDNPVIDVYTRRMTAAMRQGVEGSYFGNEHREEHDFIIGLGSKGRHNCTGHGCWVASSNKDLLIKSPEGNFGGLIRLYAESFPYFKGDKSKSKGVIRGFVTNSLCVHYLAFHRDEIPEGELQKILLLPEKEVEPGELELRAPEHRVPH